MTRTFILFCFILSSLLSCSPGVAIIARNDSTVDRKIDITFPDNIKISHFVDSLQAWDLSKTKYQITSRDIYRYPLKIPVVVDTSRNMLIFNLKVGHEARVLGRPTSFLEIKKTSVVSNNDTLKHRRKGSCWNYTIK